MKRAEAVSCFVLGLMLACGTSTSPAAKPPDAAAAPSACNCGAGTVCCAEESTSNPGHLATSCRPNCITNTPRAKVCSGAGDCEATQTCKAYECADLSYDGLKTCTPIRSCD